MTVVFISHSSKDKKIALKLHSWLSDFQFIEDVRIDLKEVRAGMKVESWLEAIQGSDIIVVIVSKYSVNSDWVKEEIEYSLDFQKRKEKIVIVIPIIYKIKSEQVSFTNIPLWKLLKNIYVSLDDNLYNIHKLIPSLLTEYAIVEIPFDQHFNIDIPELITNLRHYSKKKGPLYALIDHERFDRNVISAFEEANKIEVIGFKDSLPEQINQLNIIRENLLPLFWMNFSFALSRYIQEALSYREYYDYVAQSIYNIFRMLIHKLLVYFLNNVCQTIAPSEKNLEIKKRIKESWDYIFPRGGMWDGYLYFICNIFYNNRINPDNLMELTFLGGKVRTQRVRVTKDDYKRLKAYPPPAFPRNEIFDSDWHQIIIPQFLSYEIFRITRDFKSISQNNFEEIGLSIGDYDELQYSTSEY